MSLKARNNLIAKGTFALRKYPGKGGWTYISLPRPAGMERSPFGAARVKGSIDDFHFEDLSIWSTKNNRLFFPVKAAIRKIIGKKEGDEVRLSVYLDHGEVRLPEDLRLLLEEEPEALQNFRKLSPGRQRGLVNRIESAKRDITRVNRLSEVLTMLARR